MERCVKNGFCLCISVAVHKYCAWCGQVPNALMETKLLRSVTHPNITQYFSRCVGPSCVSSSRFTILRSVTFHGVACSFLRHEDGNTYLSIVMEYVDGGSLRDIVDGKASKNERIPEATVMHWFAQLAMAIQYLHSKNILHRQFCPSRGELVFCVNRATHSLLPFASFSLLNLRFRACAGT